MMLRQERIEEELRKYLWIGWTQDKFEYWDSTDIVENIITKELFFWCGYRESPADRCSFYESFLDYTDTYFESEFMRFLKWIKEQQNKIEKSQKYIKQKEVSIVKQT